MNFSYCTDIKGYTHEKRVYKTQTQLHNIIFFQVKMCFSIRVVTCMQGMRKCVPVNYQATVILVEKTLSCCHAWTIRLLLHIYKYASSDFSSHNTICCLASRSAISPYIDWHIDCFDNIHRLEPSGPFVGRVLSHDVTMMGYNIPAEVTVTVF